MEDEIQAVRDNIDDQIQFGVTSDVGTGELRVYQLDHANYQNLIVKVDGDVVSDVNYIQKPRSGQVRGNFLNGSVVEFTYEYAQFSDTQIQEQLEITSATVTSVTLIFIDRLLLMAAKRFDYKSGQTDMKASQVFDHLSELRKQFAEALDEENGVGGVTLVKRIAPAYTPSSISENLDLSRADL